MPEDSRAQEESARLRALLQQRDQRIRALEQELSVLKPGLAAIRRDLELIARSRAWRWGHGASTLLSRLMQRPVRTRGAVAAALARIERLEEALPSPLGATAIPAARRPRTPRAWIPQDGDLTLLSALVREQLGNAPALRETPQVSIVVVTRDGRTLLE